MADLAVRNPANPLLRPADFPPSMPEMQVECLLNPGVFEHEGRTFMLLRVAERPAQIAGTVSFPIFGADGAIEILRFEESDPKLDLSDPRVLNYDGADYLTTLSHLRVVDAETLLPKGPPLAGHGDHENYGIEDCRVCFLEGRYYLTYTAVSVHGVGVGMRSTADWKDFTSHGMIFPPHNKDCALFPERIGNHYFALHRPSSPDLGGNYIWLAQSPDLQHWGHHRCLAHSRPGMWDGARVGANGSPIRTPGGWLAMYHGADANHRYCLGALLLDLENPSRVLARSREPFMEPTAEYERNGFFGNVVFCNGHLVEGDRVKLFYGASDTVICSAEVTLDQILSTFES